MIAVDTNILVRLVTADDPLQTKRACFIVGQNPIWICRTVLLETEWVLRFTYELNKATVHKSFIRLLGLPNVSVENAPQVALALRWYSQGLDFADALHIANSGAAHTFASFDKDLAKKALKCVGALPVILP